jgi:putative transposase
VLVDTLGLIWGLAVLSADTTDGAGAQEVIRRAGSLPRLAKVWADAAYRSIVEWVTKRGQWVLEIVLRREGAVGFEVIPKRWIVERTFGWLGRYRRLSKDYEHNPVSSETWIYIAMIHRMSRVMLPKPNKDNDLLRRPKARK